MGRMFADDLAELADDNAIDVSMALLVHLTSNHYPPVPAYMVPVCEQAIDLANSEDYEALVDLPEGVTWKGHEQAPAWAIVESYHLDSFISVW